MAKKYRVHLTGEEQEELKGLISKGRAAAYRQTHARSHEGRGYSPALGQATVERVRRRCVEEGLERSLGRKEQLNRRQRKLDGQGEAHLVALACSQPPEGRTSWTLELLAGQLLQREIVDSISAETGRSLKKTNSSLGSGASRPRPIRCAIRVSQFRRVAWTRPARLVKEKQPRPRLRIPAPEQPVHAIRPLGGGAEWRSRSATPGPIGHRSGSWWMRTTRTRTARAGDGQPHPSSLYAAFEVGGETHCGEGNSLHQGQLAQYGRDRVGPGQAVPGSASPIKRTETPWQQRNRQEFGWSPRTPHQIEVALPINTIAVD